MNSIKVTNLIKHKDNVWSSQSIDEIDGFRASWFFDSIKANLKSESGWLQLDHQVKDFKDLLQLSPLRANLFRAFEWDQNCTVLEIGCGSGLIASYFSDLSMSVDAVEPDRSLAQLAALRTQANENTRVISEAFNDLDFQTTRYDVIIVCGCTTFLEYRASNPGLSFTEAVVQVLKDCKTLLSEGGQLYLAVDNGYGANYLVTPSGQSKQGLYTYFNAVDVHQSDQWLNLNRWRGLLSDNFTNFDEYYVFPDIHFSRVLLGQEYVNSNANAHQHLDSLSSNTFDNTSINSINESLLYQVANRNGYLQQVANGYLFVMSDNRVEQFDQLDFAHLPDFRRRLEYSSVIVKKRHQKNILRASLHDQPDSVKKDIKQTFAPEPYYEGVQLSVLWRNSFMIDPLGIDFEQYLLDYFSYLKKLDAGIIPGMNVDAISNNIIVDNDGDYHLIDHEWQNTNEKIKSDYVFYRGVTHFALRNPQIFNQFKSINGLSTLGDFLVYCFKIVGLKLGVGKLEPFRQRDCAFLSDVMQESDGYTLSASLGENINNRMTKSFVDWRYHNQHYNLQQRIVRDSIIGHTNQRLSFVSSALENQVDCIRFFPFEKLRSSGAGYLSIHLLEVILVNTDSGSQSELLMFRNSDEINQSNLHKGIFYGKKSFDTDEDHHVFMFNDNDIFLEFKLPDYKVEKNSVIQIDIEFRLNPSHDYEIARHRYALAEREIEAISQIKDEEIDVLQDQLDEITQEYESVKNARVWRLLTAYRDSFKIGGYPGKNIFGKITHMIRLFRNPRSPDHDK